MPIRLKLSFWYSGVFLLVMGLFCTYIYLFFTHREITQIDRHLWERGQEVHQAIKVVDNYPFPTQRLVLPDINVFSSSEVFLQVINPQGTVLSRSASLGDYRLPISKQAIEKILQKEDFYETRLVQNTHIRMYYLPLYTENNQFVGILQVAESLYTFQRSLSTLRWLLFVGALTITTASAIIGWFLAGKALQPIHKIIETTGAIEREGKLDQRILHTGPPDEIGKLSTQINLMMEKIENMYRELEESYEAQRRFVADASHELRTPLTSIRGNMDFLRKLYVEKGQFSLEATDDIIDELERVSRMVHHLLALARADAGYKVQMEIIPLQDWLQEWLNQIEGMATPAVQFHHDPLDELAGATVRGNRDLLKQIFLILFENAFKYTHAGHVHLAIARETKQIKFRIEDTGVGIPEREVPHIFDRFYRGANVRQLQGTGLGLSIAKWIVDQHGGMLEIQSTMGKGTCVEIRFPLV